MWINVLFVACGGAMGALLRAGLTHAFNRAFPWGTFAANAFACLLLGALMASQASYASLLFLAAGLCGGLSTVSGFLHDMRSLKTSHAAWYFVATMTTTLLAVAIAYELAQRFVA